MSIDCLIAAAENFLDPAQFQAFRNTHRYASRTVIRSTLSELIVDQLGSNLAAEENWNEMTRLQLENELRMRDLLEEDEVLSDWQLRLRLAGAAFRERQLAEQVIEHDLGEVTDASDEGDDDQNRKVIYTKNNGRKMAF